MNQLHPIHNIRLGLWYFAYVNDEKKELEQFDLNAESERELNRKLKELRKAEGRDVINVY